MTDSVAYVPTMGIAGTDRDNSQRRGVDGQACAHQYRDREAARDGCFEGVDGSQCSTLYLVCGTARMARSISAWILGLLSMAMWEMPKSPPRLMFESLP
jgi:hypothetical protein